MGWFAVCPPSTSCPHALPEFDDEDITGQMRRRGAKNIPHIRSPYRLMLRGHTVHSFLADAIIHSLLGCILNYFEEPPLTNPVKPILPSPCSTTTTLVFPHLSVDRFLPASERLQCHPSSWDLPSLAPCLGNS